MATLHIPRHNPRLDAVARVVRDGFWVLALGVIGGFVFFFALGAIDPGDVLGVTLVVLALAALWAARAWAIAHHEKKFDPRLAHERERRGF
jgi:hypothetical protein